MALRPCAVRANGSFGTRGPSEKVEKERVRVRGAKNFSSTCDLTQSRGIVAGHFPDLGKCRENFQGGRCVARLACNRAIRRVGLLRSKSERVPPCGGQRPGVLF